MTLEVSDCTPERGSISVSLPLSRVIDAFG